MKKMIAILIFFIMITHVAAYSEKQESFTLSKLFTMFDEGSQEIQSLFEEQLNFDKDFKHKLKRPIYIEDSALSGVVDYEATLECTYVDYETCIGIYVSITIPEDLTKMIYEFANEAIDLFGNYGVERNRLNPNKLSFVWEDASFIPIDTLLQEKEKCKFTFEDGTIMYINHFLDEVNFGISKQKKTQVAPVGSGIYIGDTYQSVANNPEIQIVEIEDSQIVFYSQILSYPAFFEVQFNERQELTHVKILVTGSYTIDSWEYDRIGDGLISVYSTISKHETNKLKRTTYRTKDNSRDADVTICIHEIKEEEGTVYHTLTFMPEKEYNQTLFLNYLNN